MRGTDAIRDAFDAPVEIEGAKPKMALSGGDTHSGGARAARVGADAAGGMGARG